MVHENHRLFSKFTQQSTSSSTLLTQPLLSVTGQVTQPLPSLSVEEAYVEEEVADEEDAFEDISPCAQNYDDVNPFSLDDDTQMPPKSPKFAESPIVLVESPLVSNIPIVELRVVTRRAAAKVMKNNKYNNLTFDEIDEYLLRRYPFSSEPGVLCIQTFDPISASKDYQLLVEIDEKKDKNLLFVKAWLQRLRIALIKTRADSDDDLDP